MDNSISFTIYLDAEETAMVKDKRCALINIVGNGEVIGTVLLNQKHQPMKRVAKKTTKRASKKGLDRSEAAKLMWAKRRSEQASAGE